MTLTEKHPQTGPLFIQRAEKHFQKGDMPQASKSAWDAVEFCLKAAAARRGWRHESHFDLSRVVSRLAKERDDPRQINTLFGSVDGLYANAYEDWLESEMVKAGIDNAKELISILEKVQ